MEYQRIPVQFHFKQTAIKFCIPIGCNRPVDEEPEWHGLCKKILLYAQFNAPLEVNAANKIPRRRTTMMTVALIDAVQYGGMLIFGLVAVLAAGMGMVAGK